MHLGIMNKTIIEKSMYSSFGAILTIIFLALASFPACTGGGHSSPNSPLPINADGTFGRTAPAYTSDATRVNVLRTANRLQISAPEGTVVKGTKPLTEFSAVVWNTTFQEINKVAPFPARMGATLEVGHFIGRVSVEASGAFHLEISNPVLEKEALLVFVTDSTNSSFVPSAPTPQGSSSIYQAVPEIGREASFLPLASYFGPKVAVAVRAATVVEGILGTPWSNPSGMSGPGEGVASIPFNDQAISNSVSLKGFFSEPGNSLPLTSVINGIEVNCAWAKNSSAPQVQVSSMRLVKDGAPIGKDKGKPTIYGSAGATLLPENLTLSGSFGGTTDLWGAQLLPSHVNSPNFGFQLQLADNSGSVPTYYPTIDYCQIKVSYTVMEVIASALSANSSLVLFSNLWNDLTNIKLERQIVGGAWSEIATLLPNATTYTDSSLSSFTKYAYRVRANHSSGKTEFTSSSQPITTDWMASTFTDDFNNGIDSVYWRNDGYTSASAGSVRLSFPVNTDPQSANANGGLFSRFRVIGDFDAQVNYSDVAFPGCTYAQAGLWAWVDSNTWYQTTKFFNFGGGRLENRTDTWNGVGNSSVEDSGTSGVLRLKRVGSTYTAYQANGTTVLSSWSGSSQPVRITLSGSSGSTCLNEATLDNFQLH